MKSYLSQFLARAGKLQVGSWSLDFSLLPRNSNCTRIGRLAPKGIYFGVRVTLKRYERAPVGEKATFSGHPIGRLAPFGFKVGDVALSCICPQGSLRGLPLITSLALLLTAVLLAQPSAMAIDMAVVNANVITVDETKPNAEAFAIVGDRFVQVGSNEEVKAFIKPETQVVDLRGRTVVPGFNDAHIHPQPVHPPMSRLGKVPCDPAHIQSIEELIAALQAKADVTPKGEWVIGTRYQDTKLGRHPTRRDLDKASTAHPIYIGHSSGHIGVANSLALQLAKVDASTTDPKGGAFDRDDEGVPNGVLRETAQAIVRQAGPDLPVPSTRETIEGYRRQFAQYLEKGITSIQIAGIDLDTMRKLQSMPQADRPLRIYVMLRNEHLSDLIRLKQQQALGDKYFRLGAIKRWFGNSLSGRTCLLYESYADRPDYFGIPPRDTQQEINEDWEKVSGTNGTAAGFGTSRRSIEVCG